jgi:hypothetical protein
MSGERTTNRPPCCALASEIGDEAGAEIVSADDQRTPSF